MFKQIEPPHDQSLLQPFEATPPRRPTSMVRQTMNYWTLRAIIVSLFQGVGESLGPNRALSHSTIPLTQDDE
jgi:hypothetical protein